MPLPRHLVLYFDTQVVGDSVRVKCENGHVATARAAHEDDALAELARRHPECRFCKKVVA